jgi:truncated hemoglobin YjbI
MAGGLGGGFLGGVPGAIGAAALPGIAARHFVKKLTNQEKREKLIKRMIEAREKGAMQDKNISPFIQALAEASSNNPQDLDRNKF